MERVREKGYGELLFKGCKVLAWKNKVWQLGGVDGAQ